MHPPPPSSITFFSFSMCSSSSSRLHHLLLIFDVLPLLLLFLLPHKLDLQDGLWVSSGKLYRHLGDLFRKLARRRRRWRRRYPNPFPPGYIKRRDLQRDSTSLDSHGSGNHLSAESTSQVKPKPSRRRFLLSSALFRGGKFFRPSIAWKRSSSALGKEKVDAAVFLKVNLVWFGLLCKLCKLYFVSFTL